MGKKGKGKKKSFGTSGTPAEVLNTMMPATMRMKDLPDDEEGFVLSPTEYGRKQLDDVHLRRSKKSPKNTSIVAEPKPYEGYSPNGAIQMLDDAINKIRDGKYKKAMEKRSNEKIDDLVDAFLNMESDLPNFQRVVSAATKLIQVCKSFREYDDAQRDYVDDAIYDRVITKYRAYGYDEPTGFTPGSKAKTKIKYPLLHNNMDKSYAIHSGDPVPDGVKEDTKVEDWLLKAYKTLGLSTESEVELEISPKIDGVSVNGTVKGQGFYDPQTRGDDEESVKVPGLSNFMVAPKDVATDTPEFGIQYELFVTNEDLPKVSEYLGLRQPYVSNRHAASGIINRLTAKIDDGLLDFISLYPIEASGLDGIYSERMDVLQEYGIVPDDMIERTTIKGNVKSLLKQIEKKFTKMAEKRGDLSFAIDGMVITFTDPDYQTTLGRSKRTNNYQLALKFDPETAEAEVKGIHLDSGKKGFRTVQVDLKHAIFLGGVRYDHVPVLSAGLYEELGLRKGSVVRVHRTGDVMPAITVLEKGSGNKLALPDKCPYCKGNLVIKNKKLYCGYGNCRGNLVGKIIGFLDGIGVDGAKDAFATSLVETYGLKTLDQLFDLNEDNLAAVGLTAKIYREFATNLRNAIANTPDYKVLGAIGIPDVGPARAKMILMAYNGWENFSKEWSNTGNGFVNNIRNTKVWNSLSNDAKLNMATAEVKAMIGKLRTYVENITTKFDNLRLGHTGIDPTAEVKDLCKENNIDIVDGKAFDMLLTGSFDSESDKMKTARKKDIPIYTVETFIKRYSK